MGLYIFASRKSIEKEKAKLSEVVILSVAFLFNVMWSSCIEPVVIILS